MGKNYTRLKFLFGILAFLAFTIALTFWFDIPQKNVAENLVSVKEPITTNYTLPTMQALGTTTFVQHCLKNNPNETLTIVAENKEKGYALIQLGDTTYKASKVQQGEDFFDCLKRIMSVRRLSEVAKLNQLHIDPDTFYQTPVDSVLIVPIPNYSYE